MEHTTEPKKSFWLLYTCVALFYVAMIITYSFVCHNAKENGANDVPPAPDPDQAESNSAPFKSMMSLFSVAFQQPEVAQSVMNVHQ